MKSVSIKSIVSFANIFIYSALLIIFLFLGNLQYKQLSFQTSIKVVYLLIVLAIIVFALYHFLRRSELKKTPFQLSRKHVLFMRIFYYGQYSIFALTLLFAILVNTRVLNPNQTSIYWYVFFPFTFLFTIVISVLESIVRVEEKIFLIKENWRKSKEWEESQQSENASKTLTDNPFLSDEENNKK